MAWEIKAKDLKKYPHFDQVLIKSEIEALVTDPKRVAQNAFFPFMRYSKQWQPFRDRSTGQKLQPKTRPIRYASRRDAYVCAYYRSILSERYEAELEKLGISHCPIAYRRIPSKEDQSRGQCNIHFAKSAISKIKKLGDCCVITLDISSYFESIDHEKLKALWCRMLEVDRLPPDHFAVFKAMTQYRFVEKIAVYERLGFYGIKSISPSGIPIRGYLKPYKEIPTQLCSPSEFRLKIAGGDPSQPSLIQKNADAWGIPQGAPISDLLANLYLIDFDVQLNEIAERNNGFYFRYSDDIILIMPVDVNAATMITNDISKLITTHGDQLRIKPSKSTLHRYSETEAGQAFELVIGTQGKRGVEYLGFRYDGKGIYLRDSTLSNLHRKVAVASRAQATATAKRYSDKSFDDIVELFNFENFVKKFGRVEDFELSDEYRKWTFWTYVTRAVQVFGPEGKPIHRQLRNFRKHLEVRMKAELQKAVTRRDRKAAGQVDLI